VIKQWAAKLYGFQQFYPRPVFRYRRGTLART
jgi:hypothetical protein